LTGVHILTGGGHHAGHYAIGAGGGQSGARAHSEGDGQVLPPPPRRAGRVHPAHHALQVSNQPANVPCMFPHCSLELAECFLEFTGCSLELAECSLAFTECFLELAECSLELTECSLIVP
jgi:hypothetical protein